MNWQFHKKQFYNSITDKQANLGKLFDWLKNFYWSHVQLKIDKNSYKMSLKALPVTIQQSKNQQGGWGCTLCTPPPPPGGGGCNLGPPPPPSLGQIEWKIFQKEGGPKKGRFITSKVPSFTGCNYYIDC